MKQNQVQPTQPAPLTSSIEPAPDSPRRGRPTIRTAQLVFAICSIIQQEGISDSAAGYFAGVSSTTLSRWKQEDEDFELELGRARAQFQMNCLRVIHNAVNKDGTPNWRACAWLVQNCTANGFERSSRKSKDSDEPRTSRETDDGRIVITTEELEHLIQARIQQALAVALPQKPSRANLPEIPEIQNSALLPEIHRESPPSLNESEASPPSRSSRLGENPLPSSARHAIPEIQIGAILPEIPSASDDATTVPMAKLSRRERRFQERQLAKALKASAV